MATFTLESLAETVDKKYAPTTVDMGEAGTLVMRALIKLTAEERVEAQRLQKEMSEAQKEVVYVDDDGGERDPTPEEEAEAEAKALVTEQLILKTLAELIRVAAGDAGRTYADSFIARYHDDLATLLTIVQEWGSTGQLGEASASSSS